MTTDPLNTDIAATVATDQGDYAPGTTAAITTTGFGVGDDIDFSIQVIDPATLQVLWSGPSWSVVDGASGDADGLLNGSVLTSFAVTPDYANTTILLTATDAVTGQSATEVFTDHAPVYEAGDPPLRTAPGNVINLTGSGDIVGPTTPSVDTQGAIWTQNAPPSANGLLKAFLIIQQDGSESSEHGYNTAAPANNGHLPLDDKPLVGTASPIVNINDLQVVTQGGVDYYSFSLSINQDHANPLLSLDALQIFQASSADLLGTTSADANGNMSLNLPDATKVFDLQQNEATAVDLNATLTHGNGTGDATVLIPVSAFSADHGSSPFIYLYSAFGQESGHDTNATFEQWSALEKSAPPANPDLALTKSAEPIHYAATDPTGLPDGTIHGAGDQITYDIYVTNTGNVDLAGGNLTITDLLADANSLQLVGSTDNNTTTLDAGQTWHYQVVHTITQPEMNLGANIVNTATVTDTADHVQWDVDDTHSTDPIIITQDPALAIDKQVSVDGKADTDGTKVWFDYGSDQYHPTLLASYGFDLEYRFIVTNTGNVDLHDVTLSDNPAINGLLADLGALAPGHSVTVTAAGSFAAGDNPDTATVTSNEGATANDTAGYFGATPGITLDKQVGDGTAGGWLDVGQGNLADVPVVLVGNTVHFQALVDNTNARVAVTDASVTDSNPPGAFTGPNTIAAGSNGNVYTFSTTAVDGVQTDTATFSGTATDDGGHSSTWTASDQANYQGATAGITIDKQVSGNGSDWLDVGNGNSAAGPVVLVGGTVSFQAIAHDSTDANLDVTGVTVSDDVSGAIAGDITVLHSADSTYTWSTTAVAGANVTDTVTINGTVTDSFGNTAPVSAHDSANYYGATAGVTLVKSLSGDNLNFYGEGTGLPVVLAGGTVYANAHVTDQSTGGLGITDVSVTDVNPSGLFSGSTTVASGTPQDYTFSFTAAAGSHTDTATVNGTVTDEFGNTASVSAHDSANYFGATAGVMVDKQVSTDYGATWHDVGSATDNPLTIVGATVEFRAKVTNTSTAPLSETISVADINPSGIFTFGIGNATTVTLAAGGSTTSNILTTTGLLGAHTDTATATGTVHDSFNNTGTDTDADTATYGGLGLSTAGLSIGYWYNHQSAWSTGSTGSLVLNDDGVVGSQLTVMHAAAIQLINSSQSATDTRQTLMSQAEGAELNVDHAGGKGPAGLLADAVAWLTGHGLGTSASNVDPGHDNTVSAGNNNTFDYNTTTHAFTSTALTSSSAAWHTFATVETGYTSPYSSGATVTADGEGLKNALQAFNLDQLVVSVDGSLIGWNTGHSIIDVQLNSTDAFWGILHDANHNLSTFGLGAALHGIT